MKWFVRRGMVFLPSHIMGWLLVAIAICFMVWVFIDIDSKSHSVSDTLINVVFNGVIVAGILSVIAFFTSEPEQE